MYIGLLTDEKFKWEISDVYRCCIWHNVSHCHVLEVDVSFVVIEVVVDK